jgi:hypothetical protein
LSAQDLTGIWRGYFITNEGLQYKLEFQVKQNNTLSVTGVSYSYLDVRFYGKATMTGSFNRSENKFQIQELRTVEVKNSSGGGTCLMKYILTYDKSGREQFLEGTFTGRSEDRENPKNNGEWGDCGGGKVYLRKVPTSDFYVEPFLRDHPTSNSHSNTETVAPKKDSPVTKTPASKTKFNPNVKRLQTALGVTADGILGPHTLAALKAKVPSFKNPLNVNDAQQINNLITKIKEAKKINTLAKNNNSVTKRKPVIIKPTTPDSSKETVEHPIKDKLVNKKVITPDVLRTRENALAKTISVNTNEVSIKLYDNGEIDGDSISVFVDNKLMLSHKGLSTVPITLTLKFDAGEDEHEVVMVAENLGRIPPNTSLMIINTGDKRYQVQITSTEQKNAMVRFKYEKPE